MYLALCKTLPADLLEMHYTQQLSVDFSEVVIRHMQSKHPNLQWSVDDVRKLGLEDSSFDVAIDKASGSPHNYLDWMRRSRL